MYRVSKFYALGFFCIFFIMCNKGERSVDNQESILKGSTSIFVDETLVPIIEEQVAIFESKYDATIKIIPKPDAEIIQTLYRNKAGIAIMSRTLTENENKIFLKKQISPKNTKFATDAVVFISSKKSGDSLVDLKDVVNFMQGMESPRINGLVFDNPNSSTVRFMNAIAKIDRIPAKGVYSFKTNEDVIKFVAKNDGMIGVVGLNWISQPSPNMKKFFDEVNILSVKAIGQSKFYFPSQSNIAEGNYPLKRDLYIINAQGFSGLGMGFSSFIAGDIGQRIILKSGLLPAIMPGRKIIIRNKINNDKK